MMDIPVTPEEDEAMDELARRQGGDVDLVHAGLAGAGRSGGDVGAVAAPQGPEATATDDRAPRADAAASLAEALYNAWDEMRVRKFRAWVVSGQMRGDTQALRKFSIAVFAELIERGVVTVNVKEAAHAAH